VWQCLDVLRNTTIKARRKCHHAHNVKPYQSKVAELEEWRACGSDEGVGWLDVPVHHLVVVAAHKASQTCSKRQQMHFSEVCLSLSIMSGRTR
jgi:hypothetical protein